MKDHELIDQLKSGLAPVQTATPLAPVFAIWLTLSVAYVVVLSLLLGPYRPGFVDQLLAAPRFSVEMLLGAGAVVCFALVALAESIPGVDVRWLRRAGWLLGTGWVSQFVVGFGLPTLEPSMFGKRAHCALEAYLYSVPPLLAIIWLQRQRFALQPVRAVIHGAIAAGALPALMMQIACMYEPAHILQYHLLPVAILTALAGALAWLLIRRGR